MAEYSISEILSFLNLPQRLSGHFSIEPNRLTQGIDLGMVCAHRKNRLLTADQEEIMGFRKKHPVHALTPHRAGIPSPVRVSVVVSFNPAPAGAHHEIQKNRR